MAEVISFVADVQKPPLPPGARLVLKMLVIVLGIPSAACVLYLTLIEIGFLAGPAVNWIGRIAGTVGAIVSSFGLSILLVAAGITWKDMRPIAIMSLALFGACLIVALMAAGGFTLFASHRFEQRPATEEPAQNFGREPRRVSTVEREIQNFLGEPIERPGVPGWTIVTSGREILNRTNDCKSFHFRWEAHACERWDDLHRELAASKRQNKGRTVVAAAEEDQAGMNEMFGAQALTFSRYFNAWYSHYIIVAFASLGAAIVLGCAYVLTGAAMPGAPAPAAAPTPDNLIQKTFDAWAEQCLQPAAGVTVSADLLYRHHRAFSDWTKGRAHAGVETFGAAMSAPLRKLGAVRTEIGKNRDMAYTGLEIRSDGLSGQLLAQLGSVTTA